MATEPVAEGEVALFPLAALSAHMDVEGSPAASVPTEELVLVGPRVERPIDSRALRADPRTPPAEPSFGPRPGCRRPAWPPRPGTDVEPTCSRRVTWSPRTRPDPRRLVFVSGWPGGVVGADRVGAGRPLDLARPRARAAETSEKRESIEERLLGGVVFRRLLRMPLHAEHPRGALVLLVRNDPLDRLDQAVLRPTGRFESVTQSVDALMMVRRGGERAGLRHRREATPSLRRDVVDRQGPLERHAVLDQIGVSRAGAGGAIRRTRRSSPASLDRCRASAGRSDRPPGAAAISNSSRSGSIP